MIAHLSYVMCDRCGASAQVEDGAMEARVTARLAGFVRVRDDTQRLIDLCPRCS